MFATTAGVLLVGAEPSVVALVHDSMSATSEVELVTCEPGAVLEQLKGGRYGLVLFHLARAADQPDVIRLIEQAAHGAHRIPAVVLSELADTETKLLALRAGAIDFLVRPLNLSRLALLLDVLTVRARFAAPVEPMEVVDGEPGAEFLVASKAMQDLICQVRRIAPLTSSVLLTGETGTGKSHLARLIHKLSPRRTKPCLTVNCAGLSPTLVESEMFGHVRGAFTGAASDHRGKIEEAADGTLFLDEINTLSLDIQAKLLRAVDERVFERVGSNRSLTLDARLIAATNRPLEEEINAGRFRQDLYYRLNVITFHLPPLRERPEVIAPLADRFRRELGEQIGKPIEEITPEAVAALKSYDWPGNIRQLRNALEQAAALSTGARIEWGDLPDEVRCGNRGAVQVTAPGPLNEPATNQLADARRHAEYRRLHEALSRHNNNRTRAAMDLGISRVTLYKKLHRYGLT